MEDRPVRMSEVLLGFMQVIGIPVTEIWRLTEEGSVLAIRCESQHGGLSIIAAGVASKRRLGQFYAQCQYGDTSLADRELPHNTNRSGNLSVCFGDGHPESEQYDTPQKALTFAQRHVWPGWGKAIGQIDRWLAEPVAVSLDRLPRTR